MRIVRIFLVVFLIQNGLVQMEAQEKYKVLTVAFWNVENLFDIADDPKKADNDFTPNGKNNWTEERYKEKIGNLAEIIVEIGEKQSKRPPAIVGLCEVENKKVLQDLIDHPVLKKYDYGIVHRNSPDTRGIDVAMIYRKELLKIDKYWYYKVPIVDEEGNPNPTRDILTIEGDLDGEKVFFAFNHWSSRRGGERKTSFKRKAAADVLRKYVDSVQLLNKDAKFVIMGDFNDEPRNASIKVNLGACDVSKPVANCNLVNLSYPLFKMGIGTLAYRDRWNLFDQVIVSKSINNAQEGLGVFATHVYNPSKLQSRKGRFSGYPNRTYAGGVYAGGYSDHFPVYLLLIKPV